MLLNCNSTNTPAPLVKEIPRDCDIVHFHQWEPTRKNYGELAEGKPWVVTLHGGGMEETKGEWYEKTTKNPHMICVSKFVSSRLNCPAYVWTCADPEEFIYKKEKKDYFLFMAGIDWGNGKGLFDTIQLAKKMKFKLKIAGTGKNQSIINKVKFLCDKNIEYIGSVNGQEKAEILSKAKALILLTRLPDACPTTVSESLMSGTPIIGSNAGSMSEIVFHGVTGFICKSESDVAKATLNITKINPEKCRAVALELFSSSAAAKKYLHYYTKMLECGSVR
jgi:glycosyltransferase involved in cell wall biosynthesis